MGKKAIVNGNKLVYTLGSAMWLTGFLFEEGSHDNRVVGRFSIKGHVVRVLHMVDPKLFVCLW